MQASTRSHSTRPNEIINKNYIGPASACYIVLCAKKTGNEKGLAIQINNKFYRCLSSLSRISHLPLENSNTCMRVFLCEWVFVSALFFFLLFFLVGLNVRYITHIRPKIYSQYHKHMHRTHTYRVWHCKHIFWNGWNWTEYWIMRFIHTHICFVYGVIHFSSDCDTFNSTSVIIH